MSDQSPEIFPQHPEVERAIDVIPATSHTRDVFLKTITEKLYEHHSSNSQSRHDSQRVGVNLSSKDGSKGIRIFLLPIGESKFGTIAGMLIQNKTNSLDKEPLTEYVIRENANTQDKSLKIIKRVVPPVAVHNPDFPQSSEGLLIEHIQKSFDPDEAEELRERMGHITLEQLGPVLEVTEGEIQDMIDEISSANVVHNK